MQRIRQLVVFGSLIVLVIVVGSLSCAPSPTLPPEIEEGLLIISHSTYVDRYDYFHVVGEVQNIGDSSTKQNRITVTFYDENGVPYAIGSAECYRGVIAPDEKSPFQIVFLAAPRDKNYMLIAEWQVTDMQSETEVMFRNVESSTDAEGQYVVTGEIVNEESYLIEHAMVSCTFYDVSGKVIAVSLTMPDILPIEVGNSSTFSLSVDPAASSTINEFALQAELQ